LLLFTRLPRGGLLGSAVNRGRGAFVHQDPERANMAGYGVLLRRRRNREQKDCCVAHRRAAFDHNLAAGFAPTAVRLRSLRPRNNEGSYQGGDHPASPPEGPRGKEGSGAEGPGKEGPGKEGNNNGIATGTGRSSFVPLGPLSFREALMPEAQFPRRPLLADSVNKSLLKRHRRFEGGIMAARKDLPPFSGGRKEPALCLR
jgi:hypothetical protein